MKLKITFPNTRLGVTMFVLVFLYTAITWIWNLIKLLQCDFSNQTSWKEEIIHGLGLIAPLNWVTVWF